MYSGDPTVHLERTTFHCTTSYPVSTDPTAMHIYFTLFDACVPT